MAAWFASAAIWFLPWLFDLHLHFLLLLVSALTVWFYPWLFGWHFGCFVPVVVRFLSVVETLVVHLLVAWFACVVVWSTSASAGLASHHFRFLHVLLVFVLILFVGEHNGVETLGIGLGFLQFLLLMLLHVTV